MTGSVLEEISVSGGSAKYTYDLEGRILTKTDHITKNTPAGNVTQYAYHDYVKAGVNEVIEIAPNGYQKKTQYNVLNKETAQYGTDDPHNPNKFIFESSKTYNGLGQIVAQKDALGHVSTMRYNTLGMLIEIKGSSGKNRVVHYDYADLTAIQLINGIKINKTVYNIDKKPLLSIQYKPPYSVFKQTIYDGLGQAVEIRYGKFVSGDQSMPAGQLLAIAHPAEDKLLEGDNQYKVLRQLDKQYDIDGHVVKETLTTYSDNSGANSNITRKLMQLWLACIRTANLINM